MQLSNMQLSDTVCFMYGAHAELNRIKQTKRTKKKTKIHVEMEYP